MKVLMLTAQSVLDEQRLILERAAMRLEVVATFQDVLDRAARASYRIIAIDLDQVGAAPAEVVALVRGVTSAPLLLTRCFVDDVDQIVALEAGADAVVSKPLSGRLLLAHLRLIDRLRETAASPINRASEYGALRVDPAQRTVTWNGLRLDVRGVEVDILGLLAAARGRPVARDAMLERLGRAPSCWRALNTAVSRLRVRLRSHGLAQIQICAVSRLGYRLSVHDDRIRTNARAERVRPVSYQSH